MNRLVSESELERSQGAERPGHKTICIVTAELAGPFYNGGIGTANRALALVLRQLGYAVDVLYTRVHQGQPFSARGSFADHVEAFRKLGVKLMCIDHQGDQEDWQALSYLSLQHLLHNRYDIVFFDDYFGTAYYPLLARRTRNPNLSDTAICVTAHAPFQWLVELDQIEIKSIADVRWGEMERRCSELADAVKAPSNYMLKKYRSYGWTIPENSVVLPNFVSAKRLTTKQRRVPVREIVFFGRLETRKGLWMFCRALDRLKYQLKNCQITFLGKPIIESNLSTAEALVRHSTAWPFSIRLLTTYDQEQALTYLKGPGRLAVMPSPEDNSPSTIVECIEESIPFIATSGSGGEELLDEESRNTSLFEPTVDQLCAKLIDVLERGAMTARASFEPEELQLRFAQWLNSMLDSDTRFPITSDRSESAQPILLVIIPPGFHADRAVAELSRAVQAYKGRIKIQALTAEPTTLRKLLLSRNELPIDVADLAEFEIVAQSLASGEATVVGLCHISQLLTPVWTERARQCFAEEKSIAALTGMVAKHKERTSTEHAQRPYFSTANGHHEIERYLMGYIPPLFSLAQETNSGFMLMRSELLAKCSKVAPVDEYYNRPKRLQDWIHEILVTLHASGERFELVPDLALEQSLKETTFEVFCLGRFMRSLPRKLFDYAPGTDPFVLSRLAIDRGLERERSFAQKEYFREIAERIGTDVKQLPLETAWDDQARQLAMIAHANGQIDLAIDLSAEIGTQDKTVRPFKLTDYLRAVGAGDMVNLIDVIAGGAYGLLNPDQKEVPNLWSHGDRRIIELKTNPMEPQGLVLPRLDLSKITHFTSIISALEPADESVRFRVELISLGTNQRWTAEKVVNGSDEIIWEAECPNDFRTRCIVRLGVEPAYLSGRKSVVVRWLDPRFIRKPKDNVL